MGTTGSKPDVYQKFKIYPWSLSKDKVVLLVRYAYDL